MEALAAAVRAVESDAAIVYPTETVYGLGVDARSPTAVERVFAIKDRPREQPLSVAVPTIDAMTTVAQPEPATLAFADAFLPGPVTVVCRRDDRLPDVLTGGRDRVGVRVPDHGMARQLLERTPPLTATSANRSGNPAPTTVSDLDPAIREDVTTVLDGGPGNGSPSTVVDVEAGIIHRPGAFADAIETWLADR